jgi:hypothetical protein
MTLTLNNLLLSIIFCTSLSIAMDQPPASPLAKRPEFYSIILPGQNGLGGESFLTNHIINTAKYGHYETLPDMKLVDLGQDNCIKHFQEQMDRDPELANNPHVRRLIYGVSQGSATVLNWLAEKSHAEQERLASCVVLEAVLGSGSSAISHTAKSEYPIIGSTLFPRFLLPVGAKWAMFPSYKIWGKAALSSAKKISPNIPVIIMHHVGDPQLSVQDARDLYQILRKQSDRVYLFEVNNDMRAHINILNTESTDERLKKIAALQAIYKKYQLPFTQMDHPVNLEEFQPSIKAVKKWECSS